MNEGVRSAGQSGESHSGNKHSEAWQMLERAVTDCGLKLFDVDMPGRHGGTLRVFIWRGTTDGVGMEDCVKVTKLLRDHEELDRLFPGEITIEVSTPGINRKLRRPEHFEGALGQRVKVVTFARDDSRSSVHTGVLKSFDGEHLVIDDENAHSAVTLLYKDVKEARIDFRFDG